MFSDHTRDFVFILTLLSSNPLLNYWAIQLPRKIPLPYIYHYFVLFSHETDFIILLHCILQSDRIFSGYKSCHLKISDVSANILPWTREQMMPATSLSFNQLAQLIVREDFINCSLCESFRSCRLIWEKLCRKSDPLTSKWCPGVKQPLD
jgi:hypothetical protein